MSKPFFHHAFGLNIRSDFPIAQLPPAQDGGVDVVMEERDLSAFQVPQDHVFIGDGELVFSVTAVGKFRISGGSLIEAQPDESCTPAMLGVYLMGSCMGAVLHQRGYLPLHGSCVTDGQRSVLITGESGAGKSTLAAEFLARGWKLITDDVTAVFDVEGTPMVQSSYPSQKLWADALERYGRPREDVHSLYIDENREKFGVNVSRYFMEGTAPLSLIVRLIPDQWGPHVQPIEGMARVDQLMTNTYRAYMVPKAHLQRHFQRCVTLSQKVEMALALRPREGNGAPELYEMILSYLGEMNHD